MRKNIQLSTGLVLAAALFTAGAVQAATPFRTANGMLVDSIGMTVYTFDKDTAESGKSVCNGPCAALWPPVIAPADAKPEGAFSIVTRDDGAKQWAYKGKPIYLYKPDVKPGDATGDKFKDVWHVIKP